MGDFSESIFEKKLLELRDSQKEIQSLSQFCVHFRQHCKIIVKVRSNNINKKVSYYFSKFCKVWYKNLKTQEKARKLTSLYLANDVVQNSKKKGPEFAKEFGVILPKAFNHLAGIDFEEKIILSLGRLIVIWQERQIFDKKILHEINKIWEHKKRTGGRLSSSELVSPKRRRESSSGDPDSAEMRKSREIAEIEDLLDAPLAAAAAANNAAEKAASGKPDVETLTLSPRQGNNDSAS